MTRSTSSKGRALKKKPLWKHQKITKKLYRQSKVVFDASDPGTGKTRAALESWHERYKKGGKRLLVICPKTLMETAWGSDIQEYLPPKIKVGYAYAGKDRFNAFDKSNDIVIINTDGVKALIKQPQTLRGFDTVVIDEITTYKHRTSQRSKAAAKIISRFEYRAGLTGTPNANTILDIWHQIKLLDNGRRLGPRFMEFRSAVCTPKQVGANIQAVEWVDKEGAEEAVFDLISDITVRHDFEKCMDIPENFERYLPYHLAVPHMQQYMEMAETAILQLRDSNIKSVNAAVLRNKLLQIASGAVYKNEGKEYAVLDTGRYEMIGDLVEERNFPVVIFYNWVHQKELLLNELQRREIHTAFIDGTVSEQRRKDIVGAYQAGHVRALLLHPQTGAHGLTLTRGRTCIWPSPIYQADFLKQGRHRIWRGGQTFKTETILVEAKGTVERLVYEKLKVKNTKMVDFLKLLEEAR